MIPQSYMCRHCFICPTYGHYEYARAAVESFLEFTPGGAVVVVDDGYPEFHRFWELEWPVVAHHFQDQRGVTRSWNLGLVLAREIGAKYTICGNSDILFAPNWHTGPESLLEDSSVGLVGPLSNGPGLTNRLQNIWDHLPGYKPSDLAQAISRVAAELTCRYDIDDHLAADAVNGFFMVGRTARWWEGAYDNEHVFDPTPPFALVGSEHELQRRFRACGWRSVVSLRAFIFHYRSVTRGERFKRGMWYRRQR